VAINLKRRKQENRPEIIDLHGQYVKEAERRAKTAIFQARQQGVARLVFIVGVFKIYLVDLFLINFLLSR